MFKITHNHIRNCQKDTNKKKTMRYYLLIIAIFAFVGKNLNAQIDQEFWFAPPDLTQGTQGEINGNSFRDRPIQVVVSSINEPAQVTLWQPGNLSFIPITVNLGAAATQTINLTPWINQIETRFVDSVMNTGILIRSTAPITAYYELGAAANRDLVALKGKNANGLKFYTPFQTLWENDISLGGSPYIPAPRAGFAIVATDDSTFVTITPTIDILNHLADIPFTIFLNRGQTYYCEAINQVGSNKPAGTKIESTKLIAVTVKDDMVDLNLATDGGADLAADQLISVAKCGLRHVLVKGDLSTPFDKVYALATEDSTFIYADGNPVAVDTLMEGEQYIYSFDDVSGFIEGSKPIYIWHISGVTDQIAGAIIPSLECTGSNQVGFTRTGSANFKLNLTIKAGFENNFVLNGDPSLITPADFAPVTGSNGEYVYCRKAFTTAEIPVGQGSLITNFSDELFHMGITYQQGPSCNYGYFTNFSFLNLGTSSTVCLGDSAVLDAGPGKTSYLWSTGDTTQKLVVFEPGTFWVSVNSGQQCTAADTIVVEFYAPPVSIQAADDTICLGTQLLLSVDGVFTYEWQDGSTNPFFIVTEQGEFIVEVSDFQGCKARDTVNIYTTPRPQTPIATFPPFGDTLNGDTLCSGQSTLLSMSPLAQAGYFWVTPTQQIVSGQQLALSNVAAENAGYYLAYYQVAGCESFFDSLFVEVYQTPIVNIGGTDTLCDLTTFILDAENEGSGSVYEWNDGSTNQTFEVTQSGTYWVEVTNGRGCSFRDSIDLFFSTRPPAITLLTNGQNLTNDSICVGSPLAFSTASVAGATYFWVTPDDTTSGPNNFFNILNTNTSPSGFYSAFIEVAGCPSLSDSVDILFQNGPDFQFEFTDSTECGGQDITLSIGNIPNVTILWSTNQITPSINVNTSGDYSVAITNQIGCTTRDTVSLTFSTLPENPVITGDETLCGTEVLSLSTNNQSGVTYNWTGPNGFTSSLPSIIITTPEPGNYTVSATLNDCNAVNTASVTVVVNPNPSFSLGDDLELCTGATATIEGPAGFQSYLWSDNSTTQSNTLGAGIHSLLVTDANGCSKLDSITINVSGPVAAFSSNPASESVTGVNVAFTDQSTGQISSWNWAFENNLSASVQNPIHAFTTQGEITVVLTVTNANGCIDTASRKYSVNNILAVPNSFTPNGDGFNDLFVVKGLAAYPDSKLMVFNRWGTEIFNATDYANDWNGGDYPDADYYYVLEVSNGDKLKGFVTLKRN
jgi:gliding motility-associated-like protein